MITLTLSIIFVIFPFLLVWILFKVFVHFFEKLVTKVVDITFGLPERLFKKFRERIKSNDDVTDEE